MSLRLMISIVVAITIFMVAIPFVKDNHKQAKRSNCDYTDNPATIEQGSLQIAKVERKSLGCFHYTLEAISLYEKDSCYVIKYERNAAMEVIKISKEQKKVFFDFIRQLEAFEWRGGGCTTVDSYKVWVNGTMFERTDETCQWKGFHDMRKALFNSFAVRNTDDTD